MNYNNIGSISHLFYERQQRQQLLYRLTLLVLGSIMTLSLLFNLLNSNDENVIAQPTSVFRELGDTLYDIVALELSAETAAPSAPITVVNDTAVNTDVKPAIEIAADSNTAPAILPNVAPKTVAMPIPALPKMIAESAITVRKHDSLSKIGTRLGINHHEIAEILKLPQAYPILTHLQKDHLLNIQLNKAGSILRLSYTVKADETLLVERIGQTFSSEIRSGNSKLVSKIMLASAPIHSSLMASAKRAGLNSALINKLGLAFGSGTDYVHHLHPGAKISLLYQEYLHNGKTVKTGDVIAAQIIDGGKLYRTIRYTAPNGHVGYYLPNGQSVESGFLRAPLHYSHISSPFLLHRLQPILHIVRPHEGVDLAAPGGTPVYATSNGIISEVGRDGGYGNKVEIKFNATYSTVYGHLARFAKIHAGQSIKQGQVIGYVGMTGLATGPHLHYEFRVNGIPHDPLKVVLPGGASIPRSQKGAFLTYARGLINRLDRIKLAPNLNTKN